VHEWALAEGVVETALELSEKEGFARITRIVLRIGELQRIGTEGFRAALETVMPPENPRLAAVEVVLEVEPAGFECRRCGRAFGLVDCGGNLDEDQSEAIHFIPELAHAFIRCPACESPDFEVTRGRGVWLQTLEGENDT